jgi:hypothetical protein
LQYPCNRFSCQSILALQENSDFLLHGDPQST